MGVQFLADLMDPGLELGTGQLDGPVQPVPDLGDPFLARGFHLPGQAADGSLAFGPSQTDQPIRVIPKRIEVLLLLLRQPPPNAKVTSFICNETNN